MTADRSSVGAESPNVLLLLGTAHGDRFLGHRDGPRSEPVATPTLDTLAARGADFTAAYTPTPVAAPARVAALTGRRPAELGVWDRRSVFPSAAPTLADRLGEAGYRTCYVGTLGIAGDRQWAGFDERPYGDFTGLGGHQYDPLTTLLNRGSPNNARSSRTGGSFGHRYDPVSRERQGPDPWRGLAGDAGETTIPESQLQERTVVEEAIAWLRETTAADPADPWLLTASFSRPHPPLTAPTRHLDRYPEKDDESLVPAVDEATAIADHPLVAAKRAADRTAQFSDTEETDFTSEQINAARRAYFASVSFVDEVVGDLLTTLDRDGLLEETIVIYASERGNLAGEHGLWWSGAFHDHATRVPLLVETPAHRQGERSSVSVDQPVSLLDLAPTVCDLAGADREGMDGVSLSPAIQHGDPVDRGPVTVDFPLPWWGPGTEFRAVREGDGKYVHFRDAPDLVFDLVEDPHETSPLEPEDADAALREAATGIAFTELESRRDRDRRQAEDRHHCLAEGTSGNAHVLDDGRLIDADVALYKPDELAVHAADVFTDHPAARGDDP